MIYVVFIGYMLCVSMAVVFCMLAILRRADIERSAKRICYCYYSCFAGLGLMMAGLFLMALSG